MCKKFNTLSSPLLQALWNDDSLFFFTLWSPTIGVNVIFIPMYTGKKGLMIRQCLLCLFAYRVKLYPFISAYFYKTIEQEAITFVFCRAKTRQGIFLSSKRFFVQQSFLCLVHFSFDKCMVEYLKLYFAFRWNTHWLITHSI